MNLICDYPPKSDKFCVIRKKKFNEINLRQSAKGERRECKTIRRKAEIWVGRINKNIRFPHI